MKIHRIEIIIIASCIVVFAGLFLFERYQRCNVYPGTGKGYFWDRCECSGSLMYGASLLSIGDDPEIVEEYCIGKIIRRYIGFDSSRTIVSERLIGDTAVEVETKDEALDLCTWVSEIVLEKEGPNSSEVEIVSAECRESAESAFK